jgi:hypothetical protein
MAAAHPVTAVEARQAASRTGQRCQARVITGSLRWSS